MKKLLIIATLFLFIGIVVGPAFAADTFKVGAVFSVTGPASFLGDPEKKTVVMLADEINKKGGINGKKLEVIVYDDEGDDTKSNLAVKKLMTQDKVCVVIGPSLSGNSLAVVPLAEQYKIPLISAAASYKIVTDDAGKQRPWVFKVPQSDSMAVEAIYDHMQKRGIKKIAIISATDGFGKSGQSELVRLAPKFGLEIVADESYGRQDTDMTAQLTKIKGLAPQAIVNWSIGPAQVTVLRNFRDLGMRGDIVFYQSHGFGSKKNIELAAGAAEGIYTPLGACATPDALPASHPQKKVTMEYNQQYNALFNEPVSTFGGHAWDALGLAADAFKAVGCDSAKIRDYLENKKGFVGQHGVFNFSADDHNGLVWQDAFNMIVVKNGDWAMAD